MKQKTDYFPRITPKVVVPRPYIAELHHLTAPGHYGFCIGGSRPGPNVLISGSTNLTQQVFQRLLLLPTLSRMRGKLFLILIDKIQDDTEFDGLGTILGRDIIDEQMFLPFVDIAQMDKALRDSAVADAYWQVLRICTDWGMIEGRGIAPNPVSPDMHAN
jgi:hypothetical protein